MINEVVKYLRRNGVVLEGGAVFCPTWGLYRIYRTYKEQVDLVLATSRILSENDRIRYRPPLDKCPACKNYRQYYCQYTGTGTNIPAATFKKGCERFIESKAIYF